MGFKTATPGAEDAAEELIIINSEQIESFSHWQHDRSLVWLRSGRQVVVNKPIDQIRCSLIEASASPLAAILAAVAVEHAEHAEHPTGTPSENGAKPHEPA